MSLKQNASDISMASNKGGTTSTPTKIWTVHVEVRLALKSTARHESIRKHVLNFLTTSVDRIYLPSVLTGWEDIPALSSSVERIAACECAAPSSSLSVDEAALQIHVYQPTDAETFEEFENINGDDDGAEDGVMAASVSELPNRTWDGLWDSLIYDGDVKLKLLEYIHATMVLSDAGVDFNLVSWNRVVLLHGPPGTGKTSLCRALAQKLAIRLSHRYPNSRLLEVNSHSLFSKWFSESGKLVQKLFSSINELVDDEDTFVVVLIDEVESLTAARAGAMAGTEPSDGLRVVNALLTQLDRLKHKRNVLIMSTSNLVKAIDTAFVDRADIIQYIDLPPPQAIYEILRGSLCEIMRKGLIEQIHVPTLTEAKTFEAVSGLQRMALPSPQELKPELPKQNEKDKSRQVATKLLSVATRCREQQMSGRALRRLPVLALARYISSSVGGQSVRQKDEADSASDEKLANENQGSSKRLSFRASDVDVWLEAMNNVLREHKEEHSML